MMYKLLALDMDGTLFSSKGEITPLTLKTLELIQQRQINITLCTGRSFPFALEYARKLGLDAPIVTSNGAEVRELNGDTIASWPLSKLQAAEVIEVIGRYGLIAELHVDDAICIESREKIINLYTEYKLSRSEDKSKSIQDLLKQEVNGRDFEEVGSFPTFVQNQNRIYKKIFIMESNTQKILDFIQEASKIPELEITQSNVNNIEITHQLASKGKGLAIVAERLGIHPSEVVAVGDGLNDISMFEYAGLSVAMGNAISAVKERACKVTLSHDEDGLAYAIKNLILRKE